MMTDCLAQAGYSYVEGDAVWCRANFEGIAYSDGDEFEGRIERFLRESKDRSLFSAELAAACVDWPSYYHLSSTRANILRPFQERLSGADVLEVGAGCGAITRFLGEAGANVFALEGSRRRARIARLRSSDLQNVTVVSENFEGFSVEKKFDVITFVGVLEYANQFVGGDTPAVSMLRRARSMLKPGGIIVIAIENQLGLKYFAGAPEDHVSRRMFGIEDRYEPGGVRTYGRDELAALIKSAGLSSIRFYAPFPDYKFPITIFSEEAMGADDLDVVSILRGSVFSDRQLTDFLSFDLPRAWGVVVKNKLGMDLANSFLVVAGGGDIGGESALARHYSSARAPQFCKSLSFERANTGEILVIPRLLNASSTSLGPSEIRMELPKDMRYVIGRPLSHELTSLLGSDGWKIEEVACAVRHYLKVAEDLMRGEGIVVSLSSPDDTVPGQYVDLIPQNIVRAESGEYHLIDREWVYHAPVSVRWLIFRAFSAVFASLPLCGESRSSFNGNRLGFMVAVFQALGFGGTEDTILELGRMEAQLQSLVVGREVSPACWGPEVRLSSRTEDRSAPIHNFHDMVHRYKAMEDLRFGAEAARREAAMIQEDLQREVSVLRERLQRQEASWTAQVANLHEGMRDMERSLSWRLTKPLRVTKAYLLRR